MASLCPALFRGSSECQVCSIENSPSATEKGSSARPWGMKIPRLQPRQLTNGRKEEPSLVDGGVPLLLIVVHSDLGREGAQWEGEKSRDHRSQAGKSAVLTFPASSQLSLNN